MVAASEYVDRSRSSSRRRSSSGDNERATRSPNISPSAVHRWIRRFERFRFASGLAQKEGDVQVNTLIYAMGDQTHDILRSFALSDEDRKNYNTVKAVGNKKASYCWQSIARGDPRQDRRGHSEQHPIGEAAAGPATRLGQRHHTGQKVRSLKTAATIVSR